MATKTKKPPAPPVDEDEDLELEELDEDVEEDAPTKSKSTANAVKFGVADLAKHLSEVTGKTITTRELRTQIRRMAREEKPRVEREIVAGNRSRYDWGDQGINHPEVKAIIAAVTGGELEAGKKEALDELKRKQAAKRAAKGEAKTTKGKKGKKAPVVEDDDVEDIDLDDDEDE